MNSSIYAFFLMSVPNETQRMTKTIKKPATVATMGARATKPMTPDLLDLVVFQIQFFQLHETVDSRDARGARDAWFLRYIQFFDSLVHRGEHPPLVFDDYRSHGSIRLVI